MEKKKQNFDELELGLDPNKYSQKPFNPARIVYPKQTEEEMTLQLEMKRQKQLRDQQKQVMGSPDIETEVSDEERKQIRETMLKRMMGL